MLEKKLVLIDSYAIIYRSYYAFINRPMFSPQGLNTSVIYGYLLTLNEILEKENPTHIAAVFDVSGETFRHKIYPAYKANREKTPEEIQKSIPILKEILEKMNIPILQMQGYEADDIIGTLSKIAVKQNFQIIIVTPDKDYTQLVEENIKIYKPKKSNNEAEIIGPEEVKKQFEINNPQQVIDILALWGDSADNIPGIRGIGETTAKKLIAQYYSIENLLLNLHELKPNLQKAIEKSADILHLSKKLVTINTHVPIVFDEQLLQRKQIDETAIRKIFEDLNFKSLINKFFSSSNSSIKKPTYIQGRLFDTPEISKSVPVNFNTLSNVPHHYHLIESNTQFNHLIDLLSSAKQFCFDTETTGLNPHTDQLAGIAFCFEAHNAFYLPIPNSFQQAKEYLSPLKPYFENSNTIKIGHNLKFDILFLHRYNIPVHGELFDTMLAHYLLHPEQSHKLDNLARKYLNYNPIPIESLIGKKGPSQLNIRQVALNQICEYACEDADVSFQLMPILKQELINNQLDELFCTVESQLLKVLIKVELAGFTIDIEYLNSYSTILAEEIKKIENEIFQIAGQTFNISSPKQLGDILFEKLKIRYQGKLTKTKQYATNEEVLQQISDRHPIIQKILEYRGLTKLLSTYVEALPKMVKPGTHKIHTSFNQTLTVTGRLSSNNPNLQNIPIRDEKGKDIRKAFIPSAGNILLSADYSQIELRLMAHMSRDTNMIEAFLSNVDIHAATASKVFKTPIEMVTREQRNKAKTANFGIIYGISAFGLAQRMNIPRKEAEVLINEYFKTFPGVQEYMTYIIEFARTNGYVETLLKRRRYLSDINSQNATVRGMAERNAINSPIQGSAADIIKVAMINIFKSFKKNQLKSKMILQVHDELIFDVIPNELELVKDIVKKEMENAFPLIVPLKVDIGTGKNWLEAH